MAQAPAGSEFSQWASKVIKKPATQEQFYKYLEGKVGVKTFKDLANIYKTEKWYKLVATDDGKNMKGPFVLQAEEMKAFIKEVEKHQK